LPAGPWVSQKPSTVPKSYPLFADCVQPDVALLLP
jgi:hypothetical protein